MLFSCSICSDLVSSADTVFTTLCGHVHHHGKLSRNLLLFCCCWLVNISSSTDDSPRSTACLIKWLEQSKTCPQCRAQCTEQSIIRIYFNLNTELDFSHDAIASLSQTVDSLTLQVREKDKDLEGWQEEVAKLESEKERLGFQLGRLVGEKVVLEGNLTELKQVFHDEFSR